MIHYYYWPTKYNFFRLFDECEAYFKVCTIKMPINGRDLLRLTIENGWKWDCRWIVLTCLWTMQASTPTWAGASAWRFDLLSWTKDKWMIVGDAGSSKFWVCISGEHHWCNDWNRNCSGKDEKGITLYLFSKYLATQRMVTEPKERDNCQHGQYGRHYDRFNQSKIWKVLKWLQWCILTGFAEETLGYFVSKHGVVQLTR